ncbi:MAG: hypothetical protein ACLR0N_12770 [Bilophila wadsworthia]
MGDSEVDNEIQQIMSRNKMTPEEFQRQLQIQRTTEKDFRERIRSSICGTASLPTWSAVRSS